MVTKILSARPFVAPFLTTLVVPFRALRPRGRPEGIFMSNVKHEILSVEEALNIFGGRESLAKILGVSVDDVICYESDDSYGITWIHGDISNSKFVDHIYLHKDLICAAVPSDLDVRSGYVYCVSNGLRMKIGRTKNPEKRVNQVKSAYISNASRVFVSDFIQDCVSLEGDTLREFSEHQIYGEVFNCEFDRAVEFIKSNQKPWVAGLRDRRPSGVELVKAFDEKLWGAQ